MDEVFPHKNPGGEKLTGEMGSGPGPTGPTKVYTLSQEEWKTTEEV